MRLLWNIILSIFWSALWGALDLPHLVTGFVLGYFILMSLENSSLIENRFYGRRVWRLVTFSLYFFKELLVSNIAVAIDVLRPRPKFNPAIIKIPLDLKDDAQITLLANVITLTPGTLTLDISDDKKFLYVHAMFFNPAERSEFINGIKDGFEKRIRGLFET